MEELCVQFAVLIFSNRKEIAILESKMKELLTKLEVAKSPSNEDSDVLLSPRLLALTDEYDAEIQEGKIQVSVKKIKSAA
jgi:hypothetical protein